MNGIGRERVLGIAREAVPGVAASSPEFFVQMLDTPRLNPVQNKAENNAAIGSRYAVNLLKNTTRMSNFSLNLKISEDSLPLFLMQNFSITTSTVSGDANAYRHTLRHSDVSTVSYTLFLEDNKRGSERVAGAKFSSQQFAFDTAGFVTLQAEGIGRFPETWTGTITTTKALEFVGRDVNVNISPEGSSYTASQFVSGQVTHTVGLTGDDMNFALGSQDISNIETLEERYEHTLTAKFVDKSFRSNYESNDEMKVRYDIEDTTRFINGATTRPSITIEYPSNYISAWNDAGGLADILIQEMTLVAAKDPTNPDSPCTFTITNSVDIY